MSEVNDGQNVSVVRRRGQWNEEARRWEGKGKRGEVEDVRGQLRRKGRSAMGVEVRMMGGTIGVRKRERESVLSAM